MSGSRAFAFACAFALASATATGAAAQAEPQKRPTGDDAARAERLFTDAKKLVREGRHAEACVKLEESERLDSALGTQFNLADCYEHTARPARAWALFTRVSAIAKAAGKRERERAALDRVSALEVKIARLTLTIKEAAPGLEVQRDGVVSPRDAIGQPEVVDPGPVSITASAPGRVSFTARVVLVAGEARTLEIPALAPSAPPAVTAPVAGPAPEGEGLRGQQITAIAVAGAGVVALTVGGIFGIVSLTKHDEAKSVCPTPSNCNDRTAATNWTDATSAGTISTIGVVVGLVALGVAGALWFTAPKRPSVASRPLGGDLTFRW